MPQCNCKETPWPKLTSLDDLLVHELQDIYNAEGQILGALPKMAKAATHPELKNAFEEHLRADRGPGARGWSRPSSSWACLPRARSAMAWPACSRKARR